MNCRGMCARARARARPECSSACMQVRRGSAETLAILLGVGADATLAAMHGFTPLHLACWLRSGPIGCAALRFLFLFLGPSPGPGHSTGRGTVRWHLPASGHAKPSGPCGRVATGRWCEQPTGDCQDADRRARAVEPTLQEPQHASHLCMLAGRSAGPPRARPCPPVPEVSGRQRLFRRM
jgi:hypothetical protein